ncbi:hypothetical protein X744_19260 [Mesorhizobium sp. LNJC372A00]|nr:hypothetical protein X745_11935 [Mesorhizobium sp. LNJC374B00]ESY57243.1 hypothetical protein X744_19260 [Mesorhizobium sp. LNJC372A00]
MVPLSAVSEVRVSNVDKKSEPGELPVRLCNYTDVYKSDYISDDLEFMRATASRAEIARFGLRVGDVIITKDSETPDDIGIPSLVDSAGSDLVCGYHLAMIRPASNKIDPTFLAKQLAQPRMARYFGQQANGSTRYGMSIAAIERAPIWLPCIKKQQEIGEVARLLDASIEETTGGLAKLAQLRAGVIHDLLTYGIDGNGNIRDPIARPDLFKDSPVGCVPVTWQIAALVSRISLPQGQVDPRSRPYKDWILVAPDHIESSTGRLIDRKTASEQEAISGKYMFEENDVIYSKIRPYLCKATLAGERGLCSADMYPLRPTNGVVPRFLLAIILGDKFTRFASAVSMRSGFPKINRTELAEYYLAWPPTEEQLGIAQILDTIDKEQHSLELELAKQRDLRKALMSDLFGESYAAIDHRDKGTGPWV